MEADQYYAASLEVAREQTAELRRIRDAVERLLEMADEARDPEARPAPAQLVLTQSAPTNGAVATNGHGPRVRTDHWGQVLPRCISWSEKGQAWRVDVTVSDQERKRLSVPASRFPGNPAEGLAEACRVVAYFQGVDVRSNLAAMHPETVRDLPVTMVP